MYKQRNDVHWLDDVQAIVEVIIHLSSYQDKKYLIEKHGRHGKKIVIYNRER